MYFIDKFIEILKNKKLTYHIRTITNVDCKEHKDMNFQMFKPTNILIQLSDKKMKLKKPRIWSKLQNMKTRH